MTRSPSSHAYSPDSSSNTPEKISKTDIQEIPIKKISVIGAGYVGLSNAILLSQAHLQTQVILYDINQQRITQLQQRLSPLKDELIIDFLSNHELNFTATNDSNQLYSQADMVIIATPTNYDITSGKFDTASVESSIRRIREQNSDVPIMIKSTTPIGFTNSVREQWDESIFFMPEFLREGQALYDCLYPSRIIIGASPKQAGFVTKVMELYKQASKKLEVDCLQMPPTEAEAVKLFANSYLATRISFFNELDSFAEKRGLNSQSLITGVGLDPRIGQYYNNPSFGYGGYCLPKDTQQLKANYDGIPANIIHAVVDANNTRKCFIAQQIIDKKPKSVGVYKLSMKKGADNFRDSAVLDIIHILIEHGLTVTIYEPTLNEKGNEKGVETEEITFANCPVISSLDVFKQINDLIIANRLHEELNEVAEKVYSRDVFGVS